MKSELEQLRDVLEVMRLTEQVRLPLMSKAKLTAICSTYLEALGVPVE